MTSARPTLPSTSPRALPAPTPALWYPNPLFAAQRVQWEALLSWQQSMVTFYRDLWDQWAMHYAGGMPIDG